MFRPAAGKKGPAAYLAIGTVGERTMVWWTVWGLWDWTVGRPVHNVGSCFGGGHGIYFT